ncbi:MAG: plasmid pRiA4b ORF-3 family protein [Tepidisphaeraceae bacterium]|jgi:hypothetical protein
MKMKDDLTPFLSAKAVSAIRLYKQYGSMEQFRAAHPGFTDEDVAEVSAEVMRVLQTAGLVAPTGAGSKSKRKSAETRDVYQLKITLRGSKPPIWRRVLVPAGITLDRLHDVIQVAMGWEDCHLHLFQIAGRVFQGIGPDGSMDDLMDSEDESQYRLGDLAGIKTKFRYEYDFGDGWEHSISVEKIIPAADKPKSMVCTAGKGRCPMEDSGGIWGYYEKLRIMDDPNDPDHEDILEWIGDGFDPNEFDCDAVNKSLGKIKR